MIVGDLVTAHAVGEVAGRPMPNPENRIRLVAEDRSTETQHV